MSKGALICSSYAMDTLASSGYVLVPHAKPPACKWEGWIEGQCGRCLFLSWRLIVSDSCFEAKLPPSVHLFWYCSDQSSLLAVPIMTWNCCFHVCRITQACATWFITHSSLCAVPHNRTTARGTVFLNAQYVSMRQYQLPDIWKWELTTTGKF